MSNLNELLSEFAVTEQEGPFYTDFLVNVQDDFPNAGLGACTWSQTETPRLYLLKDVMVEHFNFIYKYREIGAETEERWQYTIDRVFDNIKRRYEFALGQYELNDITKIGKYFIETIQRDATTNIDNSVQNYGAYSGSSSDTSKSTVNDTPIQALMENANYASAITDGESSGESESSSNSTTTENKDTTIDDDITREYNESPKSIMESVNDSIKYFRDLIDDFVDEFHVCFISTLGRI